MAKLGLLECPSARSRSDCHSVVYLEVGGIARSDDEALEAERLPLPALEGLLDAGNALALSRREAQLQRLSVGLRHCQLALQRVTLRAAVAR